MIALLAATIDEARPLLRRLAARPLKDKPFALYRFDASASRPGGLFILTGMGPEAAAAAAEHALGECGCDTLVNFGVAGALTDGCAVGSVFAVRAVADGDAAAARLIPTLSGGAWARLRAARLASVAAPVFDPVRRAALAARADLVDMEAYAIARAAAARGARCILIKGVTDLADGAGRDVLHRNLAAVSETVSDAVVAGLGSLAPVRGGLLGRLLTLVKVEHSVFSLPLLFAGAWLGAGNRLPSWPVVLLVAVAGVAARALGMVANRILDRDLDRLNRRTARRELAAGTMEVRSAYALAAVALAVYATAAALLGPLCLALSPIPAALLIGYSLLKRHTALCHFGIGACMAMAPLGAHVAVRGDLAVAAPVLLLAAFAFFWISGFDVIYALQDVDSDRQTGVRSLPVRLGPRGALWAAAAVHAAATAALVGLWLAQGRGGWAGALTAVAAGAMAAAYLPFIPLPTRFFPISAIAGVAGALAPIAGGMR